MKSIGCERDGQGERLRTSDSVLSVERREDRYRILHWRGNRRVVERGTTRHTLIGSRDSSRTATHTLMHRVQSRAVLCSAVEHILVAWVIAIY
jgi:hypothetical protein